MPLKRVNSLVVAQHILEKLDNDERLADYFETEDMMVGTFRNGREHGYILMVFSDSVAHSLGIMFAEQKSSDEIVIYHAYSIKGEITEEVYETRKYFHDYEIENAVTYIANLAISFTNDGRIE